MAEVSMVERVARAICKLRHGPKSFESHGMMRAACMADARAAIAAMREPTEAMCEGGAASAEFRCIHADDTPSVWRGMIDAALEPDADR